MKDLYYKSPRLLVLTVLLIVVAGLASLQVLPRSEDPELIGRNANVFTLFPGADAERVESLVTDPIEDALSEFEEIGEIVSNSRAGTSTVQVELKDEITNTDEVWSRVRDELADVARDLPAGAGTPDFTEFEIAAWTRIVGLTWELDGEGNATILGRLAEDLADELRAVPGTMDVEVFGAPREEILVELDPAALASRGFTAEDVSRAIVGGDSKVAAGVVRGRDASLQLEVSGELDSLERVAELTIRSGDGARALRLGDFATIRKHRLEPMPEVALVGGHEGVMIAARVENSQRVDLWAARASERLAVVEASLPRGVALTTLFDQSRYTKERLAGLTSNFALAAGLVMLVIWLMMGWRSALLVGSALPLTTLMVLQGLRVFGIPMHQMSITGLIIALGLLIDNAIVMVDEVRHRLDAGLERAAAIRASVGSLAVPLLGSTITTALAFMPIALMPGGAGEFVGSIAISVVLAITSSLFLSLTVLPALAVRFESHASSGRSHWWRDGLRWQAATERTHALLRAGMRRPLVPIALGLALPLFGFWKAGELDEQFFPPADRDQFQLELQLSRQTPIERTVEVAQRAREVLLREPGVEEVHWLVGGSQPKFYYNLIEAQRETPAYASAQVQLDSAEHSIERIARLQRALDEAIPEGRVLAKQIEQGPPFTAPIEVRVFGPDLAELRRIGERLRLLLSEQSAVTHASATMVSGLPKLHVALDEEEARVAGLDNRAVARQLAAQLDGALGGSLVEATEELPVRVRLGSGARSSLERVATVELQSAGGWTPLSAIASLDLEPELADIPHHQRERCNTVQAYLEPGTLPATVLAEVQTRIDALAADLPHGYRIGFGGEAAERDEAVGNLAATAGILLVLMLASLVLSFDSFRFAALIALVGLLSVGLAMGALWLFGYPFGFMGIVGTMGLIGVAINDSIVVLAALREDEDARRGDSDAVARVTLRSMRHVLATSITTMVGFTPLMLSGGGFWPPVAVTIGGGVAGATLLALTLVPAAFRLLVSRKARAARLAPSIDESHAAFA